MPYVKHPTNGRVICVSYNHLRRLIKNGFTKPTPEDLAAAGISEPIDDDLYADFIPVKKARLTDLQQLISEAEAIQDKYGFKLYQWSKPTNETIETLTDAFYHFQDELEAANVEGKFDGSEIELMEVLQRIAEDERAHMIKDGYFGFNPDKFVTP